MKNIVFIAFMISQFVWCGQIMAQENENTTDTADSLQQKREQIIVEEKEALKKEVLAINKRFNNGEITSEEAERLKDKAADIHALNIENKIAILENSVALTERGGIYKDTVDIDSENGKDFLELRFSFLMKKVH